MTAGFVFRVGVAILRHVQYGPYYVTVLFLARCKTEQTMLFNKISAFSSKLHQGKPFYIHCTYSYISNNLAKINYFCPQSPLVCKNQIYRGHLLSNKLRWPKRVKHKPISENTNQYPKTQIRFRKHKPISKSTNQFRETLTNFQKHKPKSQNTNQNPKFKREAWERVYHALWTKTRGRIHLLSLLRC